MKKLGVTISITITIVFIIVGFLCIKGISIQGVQDIHKYISLEDLDKGYSLDEAINDELVVFENSDITHGQQQWDLFVESSNKGEPTMIRLANYYTLGDSAQYSKDAYEDMKDEYPVMFVQDLAFSGSDYVIEHYESNVLISKSYKYMVKFEGKANPEAIYSAYTYYVLVNDKNITWSDIEKGMYSSQFGDFVDHYKVYSDILLKEEYDVNQSEASSNDI